MDDKELIATLNGLVWSGKIPSIAATRIQELNDELDSIKNQEPYRAGYTAGYGDAENEQSETATGKYVSFVSNQNLKLRSTLNELNRKLCLAIDVTEMMLERYLIYCGGEHMPFAGHTDTKIVTSVRNALTEIKGKSND